MKFAVSVLLLATLAVCDVMFDRPCRTRDELEVKSNFQPFLYTGIWFEIERYNQASQIDSDCNFARHSMNADGSMTIVNEGFFLETGARVTLPGIGLISFPDENPLRAQMNLTHHPDQPNVSNYWILSTDYANYAIVSSCTNFPDNQSREHYWLLSRSAQIDPVSRARADEIIERFLDADRIRTTVQDFDVCINVRRQFEENPVFI